VSDRLRAAAAVLGAGLRTGGRLSLGVSGPATGAAALPGAVEEARHAARAAASGGAGPVTVVSAADLADHGLLLAGVPAEARRAFRRRLLGPIQEYDRAHGTDLLTTLDAFLDSDGSWSRCAGRLHLHVNTLRYRIGRIEQLTGRDLGRFPDRVDLYLALRLPAG
jgi:DNA-binding PucR family transcriptional regulator